MVWRVVTIILMMGVAACSSKPPPRPAPPRSAPPVSPESLSGLSRDEARALLGRPASETVRAMGTIWRYRRGDCTLSLVFYPEVETEVERVLSYEFEGGKDAGICFKRLRDAGGRNEK